ncbi:hypothetical protein HS1genome_0321 [Sulfodiicoccus acidiphilus]|uniref:Uncharacterized protein n=1 Tax=Sulfodiicoccus acidiphilus TaxID=1670455 RepID=A0A348B180_9CREN|nr:DNA import protein CedA1 [Sulfodiicoccus acidiphilus]BBD71932.1 hypothetical protein HS1genome_0321 [Sulfodiicoccus acidiphilus]GGT91558.1 hypothetical protein GCM10007116_06590 [Sulfodiicoccus acidiphilus]
MTLASLISSMTTDVTTVAWSLFILAWAVGWALKGSPLPIFRVKRAGQGIIEDVILAAFWLALGTTVFAAITYFASQITVPGA